MFPRFCLFIQSTCFNNEEVNWSFVDFVRKSPQVSENSCGVVVSTCNFQGHHHRRRLHLDPMKPIHSRLLIYCVSNLGRDWWLHHNGNNTSPEDDEEEPRPTTVNVQYTLENEKERLFMHFLLIFWGQISAFCFNHPLRIPRLLHEDGFEAHITRPSLQLLNSTFLIRPRTIIWLIKDSFIPLFKWDTREYHNKGGDSM